MMRRFFRPRLHEGGSGLSTARFAVGETDGPRDDRQDDLFCPPLKEIINLRHPLVRLAEEIDWEFLAGRFSSVYRVGPGQPPLPTRLVAGLFILKHAQPLR
jgi:hypothetical protein